ncbi:MAG TPA: DHA2 family efflux MFS transporter permease subunit [Stellaceae bacterium]|jgi:EmrB/QacA subfamily drug resistance transporter|nr:DHA2 family efflux MFS transporter permease subunit [Stellaceae bacterium]
MSRLRLLPSRPMMVPLVVACAMFMQNLDSTVIATALPTIARSLGESPLRLNVAITCYLLSLAVFIPISGWTADRFGARRVFSLAIVVFTLGSIGCGMSNSLAALVAARILQGMGGALMVPVGRLVLLRTVPKSELVRAMSFVSVPALIGPVMGPPVGGFIVTYASWRWIFFINIPIGVLGVVLVNLLIGDVKEVGRRPFDFAGFALTGIGLASLAFGFENVGRGALPTSVVTGLVAVGALCLLLYVRHAYRVEHPIIDLALFKIPTYAAASAGGFLFRTGLGALPFLLPLMLQIGFGLDALHSGLLTFASAAGAMLMKTSAVRILRTFGFRLVLVGDAVLSAAFLVGYSLFRPSTPHFVIFAALLVGGFFRSLQMTSINTLGYADVPPALLSRATSLSSMAQQLSQTAGVATAALLLHTVLVLRGGTALAAPDFYPVFIGVAVISLLSVPLFLTISPDAGAEVSGRAPAR